MSIAMNGVTGRMGYRQQAMSPEIRPLYPEARLCGTTLLGEFQGFLALFLLPIRDPDRTIATP